MVISAILLQSFHSFHHLEQFVTEKHCHHKYALNKTEIGHAHEGFDHCFICEFTFSSSVDVTSVVMPKEYNLFYNKLSFLLTSENISFYSGSSFSLRGPPIV